VLAAGTAAQASYLVFIGGLPVLAPSLRDELGLSLAEIGILLAAPWVGPIATLLPWGLLADRIGERRVLAVGLGLCGVLLLAAVPEPPFAVLCLLLAGAGAAGASVNAASGRAVMGWFGPEERGLALGIRQSSTPLGTAVGALVLPAVDHAGGLSAAFAVLGAVTLAGALAGWLVLRDVAGGDGAEQAAGSVLRDTRLWRVALAAGCYVVAQLAVAGFLVLFLHDQRGVSAAAAGAVLAVAQVGSLAARIAVGHWSDVVASRVRPLRTIGVGSTVLLAVTAALLDAPLAVLVPAFVLAGSVTAAWNGLSFAAAAEVAGRARSGASIGFQQTMLSVTGAVLPPAFAACVSAASWHAAFGLAALFPLLGWWTLRPLTAH
jgi:sugar phosphate permease